MTTRTASFVKQHPTSTILSIILNYPPNPTGQLHKAREYGDVYTMEIEELIAVSAYFNLDRTTTATMQRQRTKSLGR